VDRQKDTSAYLKWAIFRIQSRKLGTDLLFQRRGETSQLIYWTRRLQYVAPVCLKKPHRVADLLHATFPAITLDAFIERTVRQGMNRAGIETLPILPEGRPTKTPTTARLLEMFSNVSWHEFQRGGETITFPVRLSPLQKQLLRLLGMDPSAYA
jgi:hypothetical protein